MYPSSTSFRKPRVFVIICVLSFTSTLAIYRYNESVLSQKVRHVTGFIIEKIDNFIVGRQRVVRNYDDRHLAPSQHWQQVGTNNGLYVFSAYFIQDENSVQIIGIALSSTKVKCLCVFPNSTSDSNTTVQVEATLEILPENHGGQYVWLFITANSSIFDLFEVVSAVAAVILQGSSAVYIKCPLKNIAKPAVVGIKIGNETTQLQVIYTSPRLYNFTVCVPCLHGPFKEPVRIIEMMEADMIFGADHFVIYNCSVTPEVDLVLRHYVKRGKLKVVQWNLPGVNIHYFGQLASMQDCNYSSRNKSKYIIQKDIDELIVPHKHKNWHELMKELDTEGSKTASFMFRCAFFPFSWGTDGKDFKAARTAELMDLKSLKHIWRYKDIMPAQSRSKTIERPELITISGIHFPWRLIRGYSSQAVDTNIAFLHHYRETFENKTRFRDDHMRKFADELIKNVKETLNYLGLENINGTYTMKRTLLQTPSTKV